MQGYGSWQTIQATTESCTNQGVRGYARGISQEESERRGGKVLEWLTKNGWMVEVSPNNINIARKGLIGNYQTLSEAYHAAKRHHANSYLEIARHD